MEYIVFEGIDCVGKSTQVQMMKESLNVDVIREPYDYDAVMSGLAKHKNISPMYEYLLFMADRCLLYDHINNNKNNTDIIISDRSIISGFAYNQTSIEVEDMLKILGDTLIMPKLIVFMQITKDELVKRISERDEPLDEIESRGVDYLLDIQNKMRIIINKYFEPVCNVLYIDADGDADQLHSIINGRINSIIEQGSIVDLDSLFNKGNKSNKN